VIYLETDVLPAFLALAQRAFAASEIFFRAAVDNLRRLPRPWSPMSAFTVLDGRPARWPCLLPLLDLPLRVPSRALIAASIRSRSCFSSFNMSTLGIIDCQFLHLLRSNNFYAMSTHKMSPSQEKMFAQYCCKRGL